MKRGAASEAGSVVHLGAWVLRLDTPGEDQVRGLSAGVKLLVHSLLSDLTLLPSSSTQQITGLFLRLGRPFLSSVSNLCVLEDATALAR